MPATVPFRAPTLLSLFVLLLAASGLPQSSIATEVSAPQGQAELVSGYGEIPLAFEPNEGQAEPGVRFAARAKGLTALLRDQDVSISVPGNTPGKAATIRMTYVGAAMLGSPVASQKLSGVSNYLRGGDSSKWHTGIANFGSVLYAGMYPGVDLVFYGSHRKLEHDFQVSAGADYHQIRVRLDGAKNVRVTVDGSLQVGTPTGDLTFQTPEVYQMHGSSRVPVSARYVLTATSEFGFELGDYDKSKAVVIDPVLSYSTYLAGTATDIANAIALDAQGNAYVTGYTLSADFPVLNAEQPTCNPINCNPQDTFVTKLNPAGTGLVYSTFVGGTGSDQPIAIAVDSLGNAAVAGWTTSYDFPQQNGVAVVLSTYAQHGFAFSLTPSGTGFNFSTYLGGIGADSATGIAVDTSGYVYASGYTGSTNFMVTPGHQIGPTLASYGNSLFLVKLGRKGKLQFSTLIGASANTFSGPFGSWPISVGVDRKGEAVLSGSAYPGFPTTSGSFQPTSPGTATNTSCAFVARLNAAGTAILAATYLGGTGGDTATAIVVAPTGIPYVAGTTYSSDFPTTAGAFQKAVLQTGYQYSFVSKLNLALSKLTYSTYLAGTGTVSSYGSVLATGLAVDAAGNAYVAGSSNVLDFPLVSPLISQPPPNQIYGYPTAAFLSILNPAGTALTYSTLFSGSTGAAAQGVAVDQASHAVIAGWTADSDLPTTPGAFQSTVVQSNSYFNQHAFVTEILLNQANASACFSTNQVYLASNYGKPSPTSPFTVTNCGTAPLKITAITSSTPVFTVTKGTCATLAVGASCTAHVKYTPIPDVYGDSGAAIIADNAPVSPQHLALVGYVYYPGTDIYPYYTLGLGDEVVGTTSTPVYYQVTNTGFVPLHITSVTATGDFAGVNHCPKALQPGAYCNIGATFTPTVAGQASGTLFVYDDAIGSPQTLTLGGNGLASYPAPSGLTMYPNSAAVGSAATQVYIYGSDIFPTSTINLNGKPFTGAVTHTESAVQFTLPASLFTAIGSQSIQVVNPAPGGPSAPLGFAVYRQTTLGAADMVYEPFSRKFYATLPAISTTNPNSLVSIDATTGAVSAPIAIGMDPGALGLSDDGQVLYVALNGENAVVPFNLPTQTAGAKIPLGVDILKGPLNAVDIQVQPGNSGTTVVTVASGYYGNDGVVLIQGGQVVSQFLNNPPNNTFVGGTRFVGSSDVYGWDTSYQSLGMLHFVIVGSELLQAPGFSATYGLGAFDTDGTNLYDVDEQVFNASTGAVEGSFGGGFNSGYTAVLRDPSSGRIFFGTSGAFVYDPTTFALVGSIGGPTVNTSRMQKWGPDGLAYLSSNYGSAPYDLVQLRTSLFNSSAGPNSVPVPLAVSPAPVNSKGSNFVLKVTGLGFVPGAVVRWNGSNRTTLYVDAGTLAAEIPTADIATPGTALIKVANPTPGGGVSAAVKLTIN